MSDLRFDGRVAIVTGAGGNPSLGRSYAMLLAERGAKVVVNDLGVGPDGRGVVKAHADNVAQEIVDAGGEAVASTDSVSESDSAAAVVQTAIDAFGKVDILINNAGVANVSLFSEISDKDINRVIGAHVMGNIWMCKAVWPHMQEAEYGRIVNITSYAVLGLKYNITYGAAKGAILALGRGLAIEGAPSGIKVNVLGPVAGTVAATHFIEPSEWLTRQTESLKAELVSPVAAFLVHEDVPCSGKYFEAAGGRVVERFYSETQGYTNGELTPELVRDNYEQIVDRTDATILPDPQDDDLPLVPKTYVAD